MDMKNSYKITDNCVIIFLTRRNGEVLKCFVDLDNFNAKLKYENHTWHARYSPSANTYYAQTRYKGVVIHMHRLLFNLPKANWRNLVPDHLDHNGLNNRRYNIKIRTKDDNHYYTRRNNPRNTSGFRGVTFVKATNKWMAQIQVSGKCISKSFLKKEEAITHAELLQATYIK